MSSWRRRGEGGLGDGSVKGRMAGWYPVLSLVAGHPGMAGATNHASYRAGPKSQGLGKLLILD